jgi:hypothetical protein
MVPSLLTLVICAFLSVGLTAQEITNFTPDSANVSDAVKIEGTDFGTTTGTVTVGGRDAKAPIWSDTSIIISVPMGAESGDIVVTTADKKTARRAFVVKSPNYDQSEFDVLTGVGAVLAGVEATSYKEQNDALSAANIGRKTPEILLGGGFILPWHSGGHWIERSYCGKQYDKVKKDKAKQDKAEKDKTANDKAKEAKPKDDKAEKDTAIKDKAKEEPPTTAALSADCKPGGAYRDYRPWEVFLSIRFAPASDQTINGFVLGGGYKITKYLALMVGYSATPIDEPSPGFRVASAQIVAANPTVSPYSRYNSSDLLHNKPGAFDGFPLFIYNAGGQTTQKLFLGSPRVTHHRSGIYFGVGIPLNLTALFKPSK